MLYITSWLLLFIGLPMLIMGIIIIGITKIFEIEIIKNLFSKLETKANNVERKINSFLLGFLFFLAMYIVSYPIIFILIIRDIVIKRKTPEITNKIYINFYLIFIPLLLIWFSGFSFLLNYLI
tara:strand:+ start:55 stop:423 length:369 start_codon:yes stop_codon:yes gene_type:complete